MSFCTAINCMDGRVQLPVIEFCKERFGVEYVDVVTEPGPPGILAAGENEAAIASIRRRVDISVGKHGSGAVAVVAHADCAGDPVDARCSREHLQEAVAFVRAAWPTVEVVGLWLGEDWVVREVE